MNALKSTTKDILGVIHEVREGNFKDQDPGIKKTKKAQDKNFECFKEYNKKLMQHPT